MKSRIIHGNALDLPLENETVDLIITSPPYFALRSYRDDGLHYDGQIGSEATPQEFLEALWAATVEMKRVLKPSGSIWVNLGDKYAGSGGHNNAGVASYASSTLTGGKRKLIAAQNELASATRRNAPDRYNQNSGGIPAKSLMGLPWRYAIGCIDQLGLILRAEIVWSKPNGLPESVTDRVRRSHEQWFHFTKSPRYFAAVDEIREPHAGSSLDRVRYGLKVSTDGTARNARSGSTFERLRNEPGLTMAEAGSLNPLGKLPGSVWTIPSEPLVIPEAVQNHYRLPDHFAAFPQEWPRRIILGWSPSGVCTVCGEGRRPVTDRTYVPTGGTRELGKIDPSGFSATQKPNGWDDWLSGRPTARREDLIVGHACACPEPIAPTRPAVVLDPFCGTGTVPMVARALGRTGIGVDLSLDYCRLAEWRVFRSGHAAKTEDRTWADNQLSLFEAPVLHLPEPESGVDEIALTVNEAIL